MDQNLIKVTITIEHQGTTISQSLASHGAGNPLFAPKLAGEAFATLWGDIKPMLVAHTGDIDDPKNLPTRQAYGIPD